MKKRIYENGDRVTDPMTAAADSLVHFTDGTSGLLRTADDDGFTALEAARLTGLCLADGAL